MPSTILSDNGVTSGTSGIKTTGSNDGTLALQTTTAGGAATTALTIDTSQNATFAGSVKTNTLTSAASTALTLQSAGTTAVTIDTSQKVGIGTTSPSSSAGINKVLQVSDATSAGLALTQTGGSVNFELYSNGSYGVLGTTSSNALLFTTGNTERMRIDTSGNVGIGVTPSATNTGKAVEIGTVGNTLWGIGAADLQISAGTYYNGGNKYAVTGSAVSAYELVAGSHRWYYAASGTAGNTASFSESMRIDSSGNLLMGTTTPPSGYGGCYINGTGGGGFFTKTGSGGYFGSADNNNLILATNGGAKAYVSPAGVLFPASDNSYSLGQSGYRWSAVWAANGTIQTSDEREKTDVQTSDLGLDFICNLTPVSYKWKVGKNVVTDSEELDEYGHKKLISTPVAGSRTHYGLLAQQVKSVIGDKDFGGFIHDQETDVMGLRYDQFVSPLVKAIQELKAINDTQAETINALTARIVALESRT